MGRKSKNYSDREKQQGRWFTCIIYEDDGTEYLLNRLPSFWDEFYYIKHDQDIVSENDRATWLLDRGYPANYPEPYTDIVPPDRVPVVGEIKKTHYHIVAYHEAPIILGLAATKFDVPSNRVQKVSKAKSAVRYLLHLDNPEKHKYQIEELINNNPARLENFMNGDEISVMDKARIILETLEMHYNCSMIFICQRMIDLGVYDEFRRGQHLYSAIIYELREKDRKK